jgi:hypothetical protein
MWKAEVETNTQNGPEPSRTQGSLHLFFHKIYFLNIIFKELILHNKSKGRTLAR